MNLEDRVDELESRVAFQEQMIDELNQVIAKQDKAMLDLSRVVKILNERLERGAHAGAQPEIIDTPPPHY
ncbi:MAG: SlyX family protein [Pseudomonadales bacterium]